jgi:hypothetical protein
MSVILYPPVMGLFCSGYVLHLTWNAWRRRRARKFLACGGLPPSRFTKPGSNGYAREATGEMPPVQRH